MFHIEQPNDIQGFMPTSAADRRRIDEVRAYTWAVHEAAEREAAQVAERKAIREAKAKQAERSASAQQPAAKSGEQL